MYDDLDPFDEDFGPALVAQMQERDERLLAAIGEMIGGGALPQPVYVPGEPTEEAEALVLEQWLEEWLEAQGVKLDAATFERFAARAEELFHEHAPQYGATEQLMQAALTVSAQEALAAQEGQSRADGILGELKAQVGEFDAEKVLERANELLAERVEGGADGTPVAAILAIRDAAMDVAGKGGVGNELDFAERWSFAHEQAAKLEPDAEERQPSASADFKGDELAFADEFAARHETSEGGR